MVEFYAPWCGHCSQFAATYAEIATKFVKEGSKIKISKVDASKETDLATKYGVKGYPTFKLFHNKKPIDYEGDRINTSIIAWLEKKTGPVAKEITTNEQFKEFKESNTVIIVAHYKVCFKKFLIV